MAVLCDSCDLVLEVDELRRFIQHSGYEKTEEYHKCHIKTFKFPSVSFILPLLVWSVIFTKQRWEFYARKCHGRGR